MLFSALSLTLATIVLVAIAPLTRSRQEALVMDFGELGATLYMAAHGAATGIVGMLALIAWGAL